MFTLEHAALDLQLVVIEELLKEARLRVLVELHGELASL